MSGTGDYSLRGYRELLRAVLSRGYRVTAAGAETPANDRVIYLRHDVDFSPMIAVELAEVNAELGVRGAFHLPVHSQLFNLAAAPCRAALAALRDAGQAIALHYYLPDLPGARPMTFDDVVRDVRRQHALLTQIAGEVLPALSWHNPSLLDGERAAWVYADIPGFINTYQFARSGVFYRSDSNNRLTPQEWLAAAAALAGPEQWLLHPFQWVYGDPDMRRVLARTWGRIVCAQEETFATNHVYQKYAASRWIAAAFPALVARGLGMGDEA
jgi:hypothetical protein